MTNTKQLLEIWIPCKGFESYLEVSNLGNFKNIKTKVARKTRIVRKYNYIDLHIDNKKVTLRKNSRVARLVATSFLRPPLKGEEVNHINGNKLDDRVENLEWLSSSENKRHAQRMGLYPLPKGNMKFGQNVIKKVWQLRSYGFAHRKIASILKMGDSTVAHILVGTRRSKQ